MGGGMVVTVASCCASVLVLRLVQCDSLSRVSTPRSVSLVENPLDGGATRETVDGTVEVRTLSAQKNVGDWRLAITSFSQIFGSLAKKKPHYCHYQQVLLFQILHLPLRNFALPSRPPTPANETTWDPLLPCLASPLRRNTSHTISAMSDNTKAGPEPSERVAIGITFGNSNSSIAYTVDDKAEVIANEDGGKS